ncbi:MAG TPA: thioredoxin family protein [Usitatibacter sp.]|nr:thioredoxin family protein [Usitatibacter sp.]
MKRLLAAAFFAATLAQAATLPYDEAADAHAQVAQAVSAAAGDHRPVLVVFGANWCPDCRALDMAMKDGRNAELIGREFRVVKVDVGRFDRNVDVAERYGVPLKKGIPAVAIVAPDGHALYATKAGELADARGMSEDGLYRFFREAADRTRR